MKLKRVSGEIDLVVEATHLNDKEMKEMSEFIKAYKHKQNQKKTKHKNAA